MSTTYTDLTNTTFPDNVQTFRNTEWADLAQTDATNYISYMTAIANKNTADAKTALRNITDYGKKMITAADFNQICDTIVAVQKFYLDTGSTSPSSTLATLLANFNYIGTWDSTVAYKRFNLVFYYDSTVGAGIYVALQDSTGYVPTNATYWKKISTSNVVNAGTTWQGLWSSATGYVIGDMVSKDNIWYLCKANTSGTWVDANWEEILDFSTYKPVVSATTPTGQSTGSFWYHVL